MRCDTCGKEVSEVSRVVVAKDYDRTLARPIYNCPECYKKKEEAKRHSIKRDFPSQGGMPQDHRRLRMERGSRW